MQNRNEDHDWQRHAPEVGRAVLRSFGVLHDMNVDFQHGDIFEEDIGTQAEYCYRIEEHHHCIDCHSSPVYHDEPECQLMSTMRNVIGYVPVHIDTCRS
jgi:hypothetical protein